MWNLGVLCLISPFYLAFFTFSFLCKANSTTNYFFHVLQPQSLSYSYEIKLARNVGTDFARFLKSVHLVYADPENGCSPLLNGAHVSESVVLIERGQCSFLTKILQAEKAGALAMIVTDSSGGKEEFIEMIADETQRKSFIPAVYLPGRSGKMFRQHFLYQNTPIIINIPLNHTLTLLDDLRKPPWELW